MELYKKHRPNSLKKIVGNKETVNALKRLIENDDLPHAILFTGAKGCGKTSLAYIIRNELGLDDIKDKKTGKKNQHPDFKELDTAVFNGIDTVRDLKKQLPYSPIKAKVKVWLLDEVHMLGVGGDSKKNKAQNALLKLLEKPTKHLYFVLCTTNSEMLIPTIKDRCTQFKVNPLSDKEMKSLLKRVSKKERKKIPDSVIKQITKASEGHPRNALQLLGKVIHLDTEEEMLPLCVAENLEEIAQVNELCQALLKGNSWNKISKILKGLKHIEPETLRRNIIGYAGAVLLNGEEDASIILGWFLYKNTYDSGFALITQFCWNICNNIETNC